MKQTKIEIKMQAFIDVTMNENPTNQGTGAGGAQTNINGLTYEEMTDLQTEYNLIKENEHSNRIRFNNSDTIFITTRQSHLFKCMNEHVNKDIKKAHGCKNPDECFIDEENKRIFIIEKKFQQGHGSVCEKIQTSEFKIWQYSRTFPTYEIVYMYCLSDWFKKNCKAELEYLEYKNVPVFWGNHEDYKRDLIRFLLNYKL